MKDLDTAILTRDIQEYGLLKGDVGAIVHVYKDGEAFEVEFVNSDGTIRALLTLKTSDIQND